MRYLSLVVSKFRRLYLLWLFLIYISFDLFFTPSLIAQGQNHSYPRNGIFHFGGATPDYYARFNLVITCHTSASFPGQVKAINPNAFVVSSVCDWNVFTENSDTPDEWVVRDSQGNEVKIYGNWYRLVDMSNFCPQLSQFGNKRYNEYLPDYILNHVDISLYDGISSHGVWNHPYGTNDVDLDRNGVNDWTEHGQDWLISQWIDGVNNVVEELRSRIGNKLIILNSGYFHTWAMTNTNGPNLEDQFYMANFAWFRQVYDSWMTQASVPHSLIYDSIGEEKTDFSWMRFHLGCCLYGDGYFSYAESPSQEHSYTGLYDEQTLDLGFPTGSMQSIRLSAGYDGYGTFVRFFDKGAVVLNADTRGATVTDADIRSKTGYRGPYYRFQGGQAPAFNNGKIFDSVVLQGRSDGDFRTVGDAIILTTEPIFAVTDIIIDSDNEGTTPGSEPAQYVGSWTQTCDANDSYSIGCYSYKDQYALAYINAGDGSNTATFTPHIGCPGDYKIYEWHGNKTNIQEASNVPFEIHHAGGVQTGILDQSKNYGRWMELGTFRFNSGTNGYLRLNNQANGAVISDAIKFVFQYGNTPPDTNHVETIEATISVDNSYEIYVNGLLIGSDGRWQEAETYLYQTTEARNVIAIKAQNIDMVAGLVASIKFGSQDIPSDERWKISTATVVGWNTILFNDSQWQSATSYGVHGQAAPWVDYTSVQGLPVNGDVKWIWSADNTQDDIVYFRLILNSSLDTQEPQPPRNFKVN